MAEEEVSDISQASEEEQVPEHQEEEYQEQQEHQEHQEHQEEDHQEEEHQEEQEEEAVPELPTAKLQKEDSGSKLQKEDSASKLQKEPSASALPPAPDTPTKKEEKHLASECVPDHEKLRAWDDARRARETNEKAIVDVMFANMESKIENGKTACNELLKYTKEVARCQQEFVKSYGKLATTLDERLHYGSLENAVVFLKMHNINSCSIYEEHNKILSEDIAVQFSQLVIEYTKQGAKIMEAVKKVGKDYEDARDKTNKLFAAYLSAFEEHLSSEKTGIIPKQDAWMAERVYVQSLQTLATEQEKYSAELEQIFEKFLILEEKRIDSTKDVLSLHVQKQKLILGKLMQGINGFGDSVESIETTADRQLLIKQNFDRKNIAQVHQAKLHQQIQQMKLAQQTQPTGKHAAQQAALIATLQTQHREIQAHTGQARAVRTSSASGDFDKTKSLSSLEKPGTPAGGFDKTKSTSALERPSTKPLNFGFNSSMEIVEPPPSVMSPAKTGSLFRKSGKIMKKWKQMRCVLTSSGFLYIFKANKEKSNPKFTVALKDVKVKSLPDNGTEANVFELVANKEAFFGGQKFLLQAESKESLTDWMDLIKTYSGSRK